jgi:AraC-like DNA-binding protein
VSTAEPSRTLFETPGLRLGEFACAPGHQLWDEVNANIGAHPHLVFPRTRVLIAQDGARPVLATPNHVVFYNPHQLYRRGLRDDRGDLSLWLEVPGLPRFTGPAAPVDAPAFLLAIGLARHLRDEPQPDALLVEEGAAHLIDRALRGAPPTPASARQRTTTADAHAGLAEAAKDLLTQRMTERLSLSDLGVALHASPFHLARVFRAHTGFTVTPYVHELRLRAAVERLVEDPGIDLSRLALDLGYCSLAHFSGRFSSAFGRPPSSVRRGDLRTIVEAARPAHA